MLSTLLLAALSTASAGDLAVGDTTTIEIDGSSAYWHSALTLDEGCYEFELVSGTTYEAWNAWGGWTWGCDSSGENCRIGYLTDYRLRAEIDYPGSSTGTLASSADASLTPLMGRAPGGYYETTAIAIAASSGMVDEVCLSAEQDVDFNVGDWGKEADNSGGLTVEVTRISTDQDDDGVDDSEDLCPDTPAGAVVDADGCDGEQSVDLECPPDDAWASHGAYVSCVAGAVNDAVAAGLLNNAEGAAIKKAAAKSDIGN